METEQTKIRFQLALLYLWEKDFREYHLHEDTLYHYETWCQNELKIEELENKLAEIVKNGK